jgi:hypothetical protein
MQNAATLKAMFVGIVLALGAVATPAAAQRADDMKGGGGNPCVGDAQKICSEFIPDRGKVASCLFKNKSRLTPACRAELGGGEKKAGKTRRASRHSRRYYRRHR